MSNTFNCVKNFLKKPLPIWSVLPFLLLVIFLFFWGYKEKVRCDVIAMPDANYMREQLNIDNESINRIIEEYQNPFRKDLLFDSYQEAWAFKQLWVDSQAHKKWYKLLVGCDEYKIELPLELKEVLNEAIKNK